MPSCLHAQTAARPLGQAEAGRWLGLGVLYVNGRNVCSAELISATEATTAAHCVYNRRTGAYTPTAGMELALGQRNGRRAAVRGVHAVAVPPGYAAPGPWANLAILPLDIALLVLDAPVTPQEAQPFRLIDWPDTTGFVVDIAGYEHPMPYHPMIRQGCPVTESATGVALVGCDVVGGLSGAPVVLSLNEDDPPDLLAEVSSRGRTSAGSGVAYVVQIAPHLAALRALIAR
ncbi:trypsin-like serine protease [bacterium]|nr:trypsin-like serine protease [bacterium]